MRRTALILGISSMLILACILGGCGDDGTTEPKNKAPEISIFTADPDTVDPTGTSVLTCVASDPEGDAISYAWNPQAGDISGSGSEVTWTLPATPGTYFAEVVVSDDKGNSSADTVYVTVRGGMLLVEDDGELLAVDFAGNRFTLYESVNEVEVLGTRIFTGSGSMYEIDHDGNRTSLFSQPADMPSATTYTVLPDAGFAFINNYTDSIYFVSPAGTLLRVIEVPHPSPGGLQSTRATIVGNDLVMVDTRSSNIWQIDLATFAVSSLVDMTPEGIDLRDVDHSAWAYYTCEWRKINRYAPGDGVTQLAEIAGGNNLCICVVGMYAYVGGHKQEIYRVNVSTGQYEVFIDGLTRVEDIEFIPAVLEP